MKTILDRIAAHLAALITRPLRVTALGAFLLSSASLSAQVVTNGSFEAAQPAAESIPPGWQNCSGSADVQPIAAGPSGVYALETAAATGVTYIGLIATENQSYHEAIGQPTQLVAGTDYSGAVSLHCSQAHASWDGASRLQIFGGQHCGDRRELLWDSGPVSSIDSWEAFAIDFTPAKSHDFILLTATFEAGSGTMAYLLIDDLYLNNVLPIGLADFSGTALGSQSELRWETSASQPGQHFSVLWSPDLDAQAPTEVGALTAEAGATGYTFVHPTPRRGDNYYQLRMRDENGRVSHSEVVRVIHTDLAEVQVYPQPASGRVSVRTSFGEAPTSVTLRDLRGQTVRTLGPQTVDFELDLSGIAPGIYFLHFQHRQGQATHRLTIR